MKLAVQLYSLRNEAKADFFAVLRAVAKMGYDGVEFAGLHDHSPQSVRELIDEIGLVASSAHCGVFDSNQWSKVADEAEALGYRHLVGGFGPNNFADEATIRATADKVNAALEHFEPLGFTVSVHNHWWEYEAPNKGDLLLSLCPKARPQLDVYWVAVGGADPAQYIGRYAGRVSLVHLKDGPLVKDQPMTAFGSGKLDCKGVVSAALQAKVEWGIVEIDRCEGDMTTAVDQSVRFLRSLVS